mgnify:CR=1 FL=1
MSSESELEVPVKKRKGVVNQEKYKRNIIRNVRVKDIAYKSYKGKDISEKVQDSYAFRCTEKCYFNISEETKTEL